MSMRFGHCRHQRGRNPNHHEVADEVTVMKDGHLVEYGAVGSVLRHPKDAYTKMLLEASPKFDEINAS